MQVGGAHSHLQILPLQAEAMQQTQMFMPQQQALAPNAFMFSAHPGPSTQPLSAVQVPNLFPHHLLQHVGSGMQPAAGGSMAYPTILGAVNYKRPRVKRKKPDSELAPSTTCEPSGSSDVSSRFHGVTWYKSSSRWQARLCTGRKQIHLGYFKVEEEAARAYDMAVIQHGNPRTARLNFPEEAAAYASQLQQQQQQQQQPAMTTSMLPAPQPQAMAPMGVSPLIPNIQGLAGQALPNQQLSAGHSFQTFASSMLPTQVTSPLPAGQGEPLQHTLLQQMTGAQGCYPPLHMQPTVPSSQMAAPPPSKPVDTPHTAAAQNMAGQHSDESEQRQLSPTLPTQQSPSAAPPYTNSFWPPPPLNTQRPSNGSVQCAEPQGPAGGVSQSGLTLSVAQSLPSLVGGPGDTTTTHTPKIASVRSEAQPQPQTSVPRSAPAPTQSANTLSMAQSETQLTPMMASQELMSRAGKMGIPGVLLPDTGEFIPTGAMGTLQIYERVGDGSQIMLRTVIVGVVPANGSNSGNSNGAAGEGTVQVRQ